MTIDPTALRKEWFSLAEFAAENLPNLPGTMQGFDQRSLREEWRRPEWKGHYWRDRLAKSGGGYEYHLLILPPPAQAHLMQKYGPTQAQIETHLQSLKRQDMWRAWERASATKRADAMRRLVVVQAFKRMRLGGDPNRMVLAAIEAVYGVAKSNLYRWLDEVVGVPPTDWLVALMPKHAGRASSVECSVQAWEVLKAEYLRLERPNFTDCYERTAEIAAKNGWAMPSMATMRRKMDKVAPEIRTLTRKGEEALKLLYPAQVRDRSAFHALEAVNLDGHKWDVWVKWRDGTVSRPQTLAIQDLYSGMILAWRTDQTLHSGMVQLAFGDVVERFGIPSHCWFDNGRENAAKTISGGVPNRYRFKVKEEDPLGLLPLLEVQVHWTTPASGQSKPIERGFRDFAQSIAKHPEFAGAWTGNTPVDKPENYGSTSVPIDLFERVIAQEIDRHNKRPGRRSRVCGGTLSLDQAFRASFEVAPVRRATAEQRRFFLLEAQAIRASSRDGAVEIDGNRYWDEKLTAFRGDRLVVRFDPAKLHDAVHVYRPDGVFIVTAACVAAVGFADKDAAREHGRKRRTYIKKVRELAAAERGLSIAEVAAMQDKAEPIAPYAEPKVIRPVFATAGSAALQARIEEVEDDEISESDRLLLRSAEMRRAEHADARRGLRVVPEAEAWESGDD